MDETNKTRRRIRTLGDPLMVRFPRWQQAAIERQEARLDETRSNIIRRAVEAGLPAVERLPAPDGGQQEAGQ